MSAAGWLVVEGRLCGLAGCYDNVGFKDIHGKSTSPRRSRERPYRLRKHLGRIARELRADGALGPVFRPQHTELKGLAFTVHGSNDPVVRELAVPFRRTPPKFPRGCPKAIEGHPLCERTVWRGPDGKFVLLARDDTYSHRMYVSTYDDAAKAWPPAQPRGARRTWERP